MALQGPLEQRPSLRVVELVLMKGAHGCDTRERLWVFGSQRLLSHLQHPEVQRLCFLELVDAVVEHRGVLEQQVGCPLWVRLLSFLHDIRLI